MKLIHIVFLVVMGCSWLLPVSAALGDNVPDSSPEAPQKQHLTIALVDNNRPYQFSEQDYASGYLADWWRLWGRVNDYSVSFVMTDRRQSINLLNQGKVNLLGGFVKLKSLENKFVFSKPIVSVQSKLFLTSDVVETKQIESVIPYVVGVIEDSSVIDTLTRKYPQLKLSIYPDQTALLSDVTQGKIKVVAGIDPAVILASDSAILSTLFPENKWIALFEYPVGAATMLNNKALLSIVEQGRAKIPSSALNQLAQKWLQSDRHEPKLTLTTPINFAPYSAISTEGKPYGYLIDLWDLWAKKSNVLIDFVPSYGLNVLKKVHSGSVDLTLAYPEHAISKGLVRARKLLSLDMRMFYYTDKFQYLTVNDLVGRRIGYDSALLGQEQLIELKMQAVGSNFVALDSVYELINSIRGGDVSVIIMANHYGQSTLSSLNLRHQFEMISNFRFNLDLYVWANKESAMLLEQINKGFDSITDDEVKRLQTKWFNGDGNTESATFNVISGEESLWIKEHPIIKFGYVNSRGPFEFVNQHNNMDGINRTILDFIASKSGISFIFHPYDSHFDLLKAANNNEVDIISTVYENSQQWHELKLTQPYWDSSIAAISNDEGYDSISAMTGKKIAINTHSSYKQYVLQILPSTTLIEVESVAQGVAQVANGHADIYIGNILMAAHEIRENTYQNLTMNIIDSLSLANPRFAVRGDFPELVNIIDKAVLQINSKERLLLFEQWLQHSIAVDMKYQELLHTMVPLAVVVLLIIGCFIYWNRRLQQEVELRLVLQQKFEHQARHDELTGLPNRTRLKEIIELMLSQHRQKGDKLLCLFVDLNDFKAINDNYGHDIGDLLLVKFGRRLVNRLRRDDFVSRFGGDEFVIIASLKDPALGSEAITKMIRNIHSDPIIIGDLEVNMSCSIGGAIFPDDGESIKKLIKVADRRMYKDKKRQRVDKATKVRVHNRSED